MTEGPEQTPTFRSYDSMFRYAGPTGHEGRCYLSLRAPGHAARRRLGDKRQPRRERDQQRRAGCHSGVAAAPPTGQGGHRGEQLLACMMHGVQVRVSA